MLVVFTAIELACSLGEADVRLGEVDDCLDLRQRAALARSPEVALHRRDPRGVLEPVGAARGREDVVSFGNQGGEKV